MVRGTSRQGEEENHSGAGVDNTRPKAKNEQFLGVQRIKNCVQAVTMN